MVNLSSLSSPKLICVGTTSSLNVFLTVMVVSVLALFFLLVFVNMLLLVERSILAVAVDKLLFERDIVCAVVPVLFVVEDVLDLVADAGSAEA